MTYLREQANRLALAQHWARGGAYSSSDEIWRPICTAAALAALFVETEGELRALLELLEEASSNCPEIENVWHQAAAELRGVMSQGLTRELLDGVTDDGVRTWNAGVLRTKAHDLLHSAHAGALALLAARAGGSDQGR